VAPSDPEKSKKDFHLHRGKKKKQRKIPRARMPKQSLPLISKRKGETTITCFFCEKKRGKERKKKKYAFSGGVSLPVRVGGGGDVFEKEKVEKPSDQLAGGEKGRCLPGRRGGGECCSLKEKEGRDHGHREKAVGLTFRGKQGFSISKGDSALPGCQRQGGDDFHCGGKALLALPRGKEKKEKKKTQSLPQGE